MSGATRTPGSTAPCTGSRSQGLAGTKTLADLEERRVAGQPEHAVAERPGFITSLPRARTILLLEMLSVLPDFASHTYRNMPLVPCPVLWDRLSQAFRKDGQFVRAGARRRHDGRLRQLKGLRGNVWTAFSPER